MITFDTDIASWLSTYASLTVTRVFDLFGLKLNKEQTISAVKDKQSIYYLLAQVPLNNIYNGIILTQVMDYRSYAQRIFVDYLTSGAGVEDHEAPGSTIRESLEEERLNTVEFGSRLDQEENTNRLLIAESQEVLIQLARKIKTGETDELRDEIHEKSADYLAQSLQMNTRFCDLRRDIQGLILRSTNLVALLPDYRPKEDQSVTRAAIDFDSKIGEDLRLSSAR